MLYELLPRYLPVQMLTNQILYQPIHCENSNPAVFYPVYQFVCVDDFGFLQWIEKSSSQGAAII